MLVDRQRVKRCMLRGQRLSRTVRGQGLGIHSPPMKRNIFEMNPLTVFYKTQTQLTCHQHLVSSRLVSAFSLRGQPAATFLHLRCSTLYTKNKLSQIITSIEDLIKVKFTLASNSVTCLNTQFENTLKYYTKSDILTKNLRF